MRYAVIGDLHINLRSSPQWESSRILQLVPHINTPSYDAVILAGDTFDRSRPTLEEILLFNSFCEGIDTDVYVIDGNHEAVNDHRSTFDFLPELHHKYVPYSTTLLDGITLVSWSQRHRLSECPDDTVLISHLRSDYGKYIKAEVDFDAFRHKFQLIVLGDIHSKHSPYMNTLYTTSPMATHYESHKSPPEHGFGVVEIVDGNPTYEYVTLNLPAKRKLDVQFRVLQRVLEDLPEQHRYKITISGTPEELVQLEDTQNITYVRQVQDDLAEYKKPELDLDDTHLIRDRIVESTATHQELSLSDKEHLDRIIKRIGDT